MKKPSYLSISLVTLVLGITSLVSVTPEHAQAANIGNWRAGKIIDDAVFTNKNDMSVAEIQNFLNNKVPACDTNGVKTSEFGGGTRAEYGAANGNPAPFTCLKDYYEVPKTSPGPGIPASNYGGAPVPNGSRSAAQLIWDAAQRYNINPKVLLVTIQKESAGPLTSDDWPFKKQYTYAMGAYCPDSGPGGSANCDENYAGFSIQISESAALMRWYLDNMEQPWWSYKKPGNNSILYHPNRDCGSDNVFIESKATAALYTYTPYQPNQAALNNLYGTGDGCSSYGNRNFWRIYSDWFGTTTGVNGHIRLSKPLTVVHPTPNLYVNDTVSASFEIENQGGRDDYVGGVGVCARINGQNYDFGFIHHQYIPAYGKVTVNMSRKMPVAGNINIFICSYHPVLGWASTYYPYDISGAMNRTVTLGVNDNPYITSGISISPANPVAGQPTTASLVLRNTSTNPINVGSLVIAVRSPYGDNFDYELVNDVIIPANSTYTYSKTKAFGATGNYSMSVANWNGVWSTSYPKSIDSSIARTKIVTMRDNPVVSSGISFSPNPTAGQPVTATFVLRNDSPSPMNIGSMIIAGRGPGSTNMDFPIANDVIVPANGTYTYSKTRVLPTTGSYSFFIANWNGVWSTSYPKSIDSSIIRQTTLQVN